jgi:hypothetical protein
MERMSLIAFEIIKITHGKQKTQFSLDKMTYSGVCSTDTFCDHRFEGSSGRVSVSLGIKK